MVVRGERQSAKARYGDLFCKPYGPFRMPCTQGNTTLLRDGRGPDLTEQAEAGSEKGLGAAKKEAHAFVVAVADADNGERIRGDYRLPACLGL